MPVILSSLVVGDCVWGDFAAELVLSRLTQLSLKGCLQGLRGSGIDVICGSNVVAAAATVGLLGREGLLMG